MLLFPCNLPARLLQFPWLRRARSASYKRYCVGARRAITMEIQLTAEEDQLCVLLDECTKHMRANEGLETSCRIAGGWVRDKLLGMQSNDIDVALTDMMGMTFAERFVAYCSEVEGISAKHIAKIESNPDQSKHLETARTTVLGHELDFVNLRSEEYAEHSRIPSQVSFGTPLQDALRRDITINALFYNVHSRSVEDHTGKGVQDLRIGLIRTPLPPIETLTDDPLRVIRCIRFASRFGFELDPELRDAAKNPSIQSAIVSKISRERVGEEIDKMMQGSHPVRALKLIDELSLYGPVFHVPDSIAQKLSQAPAPSPLSVAAAATLEYFLRRSTSLPLPLFFSSINLPPLHPLLLSEVNAKPSPIPRLYLACALTPYRGITYSDTKGKLYPATDIVIRESLKLGTQHHYLDGIPTLFAAWERLSPVVSQWTRGSDMEDRVKIGLVLREKTIRWLPTDVKWQVSLLFSLVQDLVSFWDVQRNTLDVDNAITQVEKYNAFVSRIEELGLPALVDAKPILDGRGVVSTLDAKPGQWTGQVLARVTEWQLAHPQGTKEQCQEWLKAEYAAGRIEISIDEHPSKRRQGGNSADENTKKAKR